MLQEIRARSLSPDYQHVIVMPTEKCNFRCTYCYERFDIGRMKPNVVEAVKRFSSKRIENAKAFHLGWFGGEPLLAREIVLDISSHCHSECSSHNVEMHGSITTNGFLLDAEYFRSLVNFGIKEYQISVDGPEEVHNKTRVQANGAGTFKTIMGNIDSALKTDLEFQIVLRLHFLQHTLDHVYELIDFVNDNWRDPRLVVHFAPIQRLGSDNDQNIDVVKNASKDEILENLRSALSDRQQALVLNDPASPYVCYASKMNSIVVRADGRISKCTVALYNDKNVVGRLCDDGSLEIESDKFKAWGIGLETGKLDQLGCPAHAVLSRS